MAMSTSPARYRKEENLAIEGHTQVRRRRRGRNSGTVHSWPWRQSTLEDQSDDMTHPETAPQSKTLLTPYLLEVVRL